MGRKSDQRRKKRPKALSMFAGCGGFDLGFSNAGFEIVWANDIDRDACSTYQANVKARGITHIGSEGIICDDVSNLQPPHIPELDVLMAGFPCQPFSNAGQRKSVADARGTLFEYCIDYIASLRPKLILFENVRGFLSIKGHGKRICEEVMDQLFDLDYKVYINLLNAAHYAVPQNRLRVFIVGVRNDCGITGYSFPQKVWGRDLSLGGLLNVPPDTPNQNDLQPLNPQAIRIGKMVPEGGSWKSIEYEELPPRMQRIRDNMRRYRWPNFFRRFARHEIAGTITAAFKPENAGVWHSYEDRVLSAREVARIQSFPDDFVFLSDSVKAIYAMIGNAVPPLLAEAFANSFLNSMMGSVSPDPAYRDYFEVRRSSKPIRPGEKGMIYNPSSRRITERSLLE